MTLRLKIVLVCMAVTAAVVSIAGVALVRSVSNDLRLSHDRELTDISRNFTPQVVNALANDASLERAVGLRGGKPTRGIFRDEVVFNLGDVPDVGLAAGVGFDVVEVSGNNTRRLTRDVRSGRGIAFVEVFSSLGPIEERVAFVRNRAIIVGLIAVAAAGTVGTVLGRAITRPLRKLSVSTAAIGSTADLTRRIDIGSSPREVAEVVSVLNEMLDRLASESGRTRQSLEAARAFASDATHELRTPLTAVANNVEILLRHPELDAEQRAEILEEINERQTTVTRVLGALRDLARGELPVADDWEIVDLAEVVDAAVALLAHDQTVTISFSGEGQHLIHGWPDGIRILVDNVLSNATTHGRALDGRANVLVTVNTDVGDSRGAVMLRVEDGGLGIAASDVERLQRRYERGDTPTVGTGLGLSLVRQQVDLHRGSLHIGRSALGGASVVIGFPSIEQSQQH